MKLNRRQKTVLRLRQKGLTFKEIGRRMGLGAQRPHQIYHNAIRILRYGEHWTDGLGVRISNMIEWYGIKNKEELYAAYKSKSLLSKRNFGYHSQRRLGKWFKNFKVL